MRARATVLVTGATSGLGEGVAAALAAAGHQVIVHGRDPDRVARTVAALGPEARPAVADLSSLAETTALAERIAADHERLDVLINNAAAGFGPPGEARSLSRDGHELRMAVNYLAPVVLTRALLPLLRASAPSRVVNVGSVGQVAFAPEDFEFESGYEGVTAYRRSKLALAAFTFDLAEELRGSGVTVNCLHPASLMPTAMVLESRVRPMATVAEGVAATVRLAADPALAETTGRFYDGMSPSRARPEAYDPGFRRSLRQITDELVTQALAGGKGTH